MDDAFCQCFQMVLLKTRLRPDLSGALFMQRSGIKKRERRAEIVAINKKFDQHHSKFYVFTLS